jgi:hypothetical protein
MTETFTYDVLISHSAKDKPVVRELAERLKKDGLRVWFDDWEIQPGATRPTRSAASSRCGWMRPRLRTG